MWILSLNRTHDASICLMEDDKIILHLQEERLTHAKYDSEVINCLHLIRNYTSKIDILCLSTLYNSHRDFVVYLKLLNYIGIEYSNIKFYHKDHHLLHSMCAFYNSKFDSAVSVILDGAGSDTEFGKENESVYIHKYPTKFECLHKSYIDSPSKNIEEDLPNYVKENKFGVGMVYSAVTEYLGFHSLDCGKTMGLSSYGENDSHIEEMISNCGGIESKFLLGSTTTENFSHKNTHLKFQSYDYLSLFKNENEKFKKHSNLAYKLQKEFEEYVYNLILYAVKISGEKNVILSGGCALNCVANYRILKKLPKDINLYVEPVSGDSGVTIGAAKYSYLSSLESLEKIEDRENLSLDNLYLGQEINLDYFNYLLTVNESEKITTPKEVAELLSLGNIVAICQGRSESGPRALGNRSILFDPRVKDGKEIVNRVKRREWWRPFAGTVLLEHSREWFDMDRLEESPHMMYAVDVWEDKRDLIPNITHVDGTCRIQTLRKEYNPNYYELIEEFYKLTNVPILFNTSFNLAGDTIVETIEDAFRTLRESEIEYMYLPEIQKLIYVPNK
jgi:carbamoyltransferase